MSEAEKNKEISNDWDKNLYQIAHSDTRWAKEQGWRVVNWSLLLFGALIGVKSIVTMLPVCALITADLFVLIVAGFYVIDLHLWTNGMRKTCDTIEKRIPNVDSTLEWRKRDKYHYKYLVVQLVIIFGAAIFTAVTQWYSLPKIA